MTGEINMRLNSVRINELTTLQARCSKAMLGLRLRMREDPSSS
jgi:hypothetical protein